MMQTTLLQPIPPFLSYSLSHSSAYFITLPLPAKAIVKATPLLTLKLPCLKSSNFTLLQFFFAAKKRERDNKLGLDPVGITHVQTRLRAVLLIV